MRIKHIEVFNAIMLTGSVSGAARLLHVSQPAVTQVLQHAELQLGFALFERQANRLVPTQEAKTLHPEVTRLMSQLEIVRRMGKARASDQGQPLRILIVPSLAVTLLPEALRHLRRKFPDTPVSIRTLHSSEIAQAVALQEADIGIVYGHPPLPPGVQEDGVATGRLVCVYRVEKADSDKRSTIAMEEVLRSPFICIDERDPLGAMLADQWSRLGVQVPPPDIKVQTHHIALVLAEEGFGPAIIDSFTARAGRHPNLHTRTLVPEVPVEITALRPARQRQPATVRCFLDALARATQD
ncbi:MAG: LysR family transcriptional regulator [Rubrivivax sp.]